MVDYITREEKMELKLKEGVKVDSFTFKKGVDYREFQEIFY